MEYFSNDCFKSNPIELIALRVCTERETSMNFDFELMFIDQRKARHTRDVRRIRIRMCFFLSLSLSLIDYHSLWKIGGRIVDVTIFFLFLSIDSIA